MSGLFRNWFSALSLKKKFNLSLFIFILCPLIISVIVINVIINQNILSRSREIILMSLMQSRQALTNTFNYVNDTSTYLINDENLQEIGKFYSKENLEFNSFIPSLELHGYNLSRELSKKSSYYSICFSKSGTVLYQFDKSGRVMEQADASCDKQAYALAGKGFWTTLDSQYSDQKKVFSYVRAIHDLTDFHKYLGILKVSINENDVYDLFKNANAWKNSDIFIVDENGNILSSGDKSKLGQPYSQIDRINSYFMGQNGFFSKKLGNTAFDIFYYRIPDTTWHVVLSIPESELNKELRILNFILLLSILVCIIFGIAFTIIQNFTIISPLSRIVKATGEIKNENFDFSLNINKKDEIGILASAFMEMSVRLKNHIIKGYQDRINLREAELLVLQTQINPHFLYNTLDSIRFTALENGDEKAGEQIEILSEIFRYVLNKNEETTTIAQELEFVKNYISLQKNRFGNRLEVVYNIDENVLDCEAMRLILQPLVENSIYHGVEKKIGPGKITVNILKDGDRIKYIVSDDGMGSDEALVNQIINSDKNSKKVFALKNINNRIQLEYGNEYGLSFSSVKGMGTTVEVTFPCNPGVQA